MASKKDVIHVGDTIELLSMDDGMSKLTKGSRGVVITIDEEQDLIWVKWENGEKLALIRGLDKFKKIN